MQLREVWKEYCLVVSIYSYKNLLNQSFRSRTYVSHLSMLQEFSFPLNAPHETEKLHSIRQCSNVDQTNLTKKWKDQSHLNSWPLNPEDFQPYSAIP